MDNVDLRSVCPEVWPSAQSLRLALCAVGARGQRVPRPTVPLRCLGCSPIMRPEPVMSMGFMAVDQTVRSASFI